MPSYSEYTISELYSLIATGDERAFNIVYERHWRKLFRFLYRMTKSREVAEELLVDVFLKLWIGRELVPEIQNMDSFLYKVAYHKALDFLKLTARKATLQKVVARQMADISAEEADQHLLAKEYQQIIEQAIRRLSPQRKLVFTLSREQGMTHEQIARQLNLSPKTVKRTMSDALESIRTFFKDHHPEIMSSLWFFL
jgi:RNA polymerase sigma-70 factor (ECF subfamily)